MVVCRHTALTHRSIIIISTSHAIPPAAPERNCILQPTPTPPPCASRSHRRPVRARQGQQQGGGGSGVKAWVVKRDGAVTRSRDHHTNRPCCEYCGLVVAPPPPTSAWYPAWSPCGCHLLRYTTTHTHSISDTQPCAHMPTITSHHSPTKHQPPPTHSQHTWRLGSTLFRHQQRVQVGDLGHRWWSQVRGRLSAHPSASLALGRHRHPAHTHTHVCTHTSTSTHGPACVHAQRAVAWLGRCVGRVPGTIALCAGHKASSQARTSPPPRGTAL